MNSIRIKNLRCFVDTDKIDLLPLTIAVGKNSCGKSTILRVFPLFKQSLETKISEPILWYGRYVDFGEFKQSLSKYSSEKNIIEFEFEFEVDLEDRYRYLLWDEEKLGNEELSEISIRLGVEEKEIKYVEFILFATKICILYHGNKGCADIYIDDNKKNTLSIDYKMKIGNIVPNVDMPENDIGRKYRFIIETEDRKNWTEKNNDLIKYITQLSHQFN